MGGGKHCECGLDEKIDRLGRNCLYHPTAAESDRQGILSIIVNIWAIKTRNSKSLVKNIWQWVINNILGYVRSAMIGYYNPIDQRSHRITKIHEITKISISVEKCILNNSRYGVTWNCVLDMSGSYFPKWPLFCNVLYFYK